MNAKALLVLLLLFVGINLHVGFAQSGERDACTQPSSYANSFSAINLTDEEYEAVRNTAPPGTELVYFLQSPSCRYQMRVYSIPGDVSDRMRHLTVWDTAAQRTIIDYQYQRDNNRVYNVWFWNPGETEVVIGGYFKSVYPHFSHPRGDYHLWNLATSTSVVLHCPTEDGCIEPSYGGNYWDDARNWVWTESSEGVLAYDRGTGAVVRSFPNPPWGGLAGGGGGHNYQFSSDGKKLLVVFKAGSGLNDAITLWDVNSMTSSPINVEGWAGRGTYINPRTPMSECASAISLSSDNRYLAIGDVVIRVWDMQNLQPAYEDRLPLYRHEGPEARIDCLRFVDATTVETESRDGVQRWDVLTGTLISQVDGG